MKFLYNIKCIDRKKLKKGAFDNWHVILSLSELQLTITTVCLDEIDLVVFSKSVCKWNAKLKGLIYFSNTRGVGDGGFYSLQKWKREVNGLATVWFVIIDAVFNP